jgi:hypothetical protein
LQSVTAEIEVGVDTYHVSPEPALLTAELRGSLALCLHDERRAVGGLLHLRFTIAGGRPSDVTDNTLSAVLLVLDRFKGAVLGGQPRRDDVHARIIAHAPPSVAAGEPSATLVDLVRADLADGRVSCGTQVICRLEAVRVRFEPFAGRVWICGPGEAVAAPAPRRRL